MEGGNEIRNSVVKMLDLVRNSATTPAERQRALATIADALFSNSEEDNDCGRECVASVPCDVDDTPQLSRNLQGTDTHMAKFAQRLRELLDARRMSQSELAERIGCSQPAISQMLNRNRRPRKRTILKLANALNVQAHELWPDIQVAEMLDAVASFQRDGYLMTDAEAAALSDASKRNLPRIPTKSLPIHRQQNGDGG